MRFSASLLGLSPLDDILLKANRSIGCLLQSFETFGFAGSVGGTKAQNSLYSAPSLIHCFIRAFSSVGCVVLFFFGIKFLLLSENQAIFHSAPIIATILAAPILGERIGFHRFFAIIIGFVGVLIILKPGTGLFKIYSLIPLASACFMAFAYLSTRYLMSTESSVAIIFYYSLALLFTSLCFFPADFIFPNLIELLPLTSIGIIGTLGHFFLSQAAKNAEVIVITPFEYTSFIFVSLLAYIFFNEIPDISIYIGTIFIVISGIYIMYREQNQRGKKTYLP